MTAMDRTETTQILAVLRAAYPRFYAGMGREELQGIVALWQEMFAGDSYAEVAAAVKAHIAADQKGFPPHIGAIRNMLVRLRQRDNMTELEAWALVEKALQNAAYGAQEEFDRLPPVVQRLVGTPNQLRSWAMMDLDTVASVVASNFQRSYKARAASEREVLAMPEDIRRLLGSATRKLAEIGDGT